MEAKQSKRDISTTDDLQEANEGTSKKPALKNLL